MEYPTIRPEWTPSIARGQTMLADLAHPVTSVSHSWVGGLVVKLLSTRTSWAGRSGFLPFWPCFSPNALRQPLAEQVAYTTR